MKTNLDKWNYYYDFVKNKEKKFVDKIIKEEFDECPKFLYTYNLLDFEVKELKIKDIYYRDNSRKLYFFTKKPTREDIKRLKEYIEKDEDLNKKNILIEFEEKFKKYNVSSAIKLSELNNKIFLDKNDAEKEAIKLKNKKEHEENLLNHGHIRCTYCSKIVPEEKSINYTIIFQNSKPDPFSKSGYKRFVDKKTNKYCSGRCGAHDQMAHEG